MKLYCNCTFVELEQKKTQKGKDFLILTVLDEKRFANNVSVFDENLLDVSKLKPESKLKLTFESSYYNGKTNLRVIGCDVIG